MSKLTWVSLWFALFFGMMFTLCAYNYHERANSLTLVGDYIVSNYTSQDGVHKIILLSKDRLNETIILENENDITDRILVAKIPYSY